MRELVYVQFTLLSDGIVMVRLKPAPVTVTTDASVAFTQDKYGYLWFGTQNGAFKLTGDSIIHIDSIKSTSGKGVTIKDIAEAKDGKIWFGHEGGISSIDGTLVTNYYKSDGLIPRFEFSEHELNKFTP